ncbi:MAG: hypothetical protein A6F72_05215 [Cycloclasticus sp. symbiont of Poecilosclerida sp. N]|nr:MAG: hypothetical protein A6F72_05215 [Cycloclasticus sp. symbiont of Poecilosclerida sp. N]
MFNHLLQIASFQSKPQNFKSPIWAILLFSIFFIAVQGYALSLSPGNDLTRMMVASFLKILTIAALLFMWLNSLKQGEHFPSTFLVIVVTSFMTELIKFPLSTMIRETEMNQDVMMAIVYSLPLWATVIWQYCVWYYVLKEVSSRAKGELITVMIVLVMVSEVAGSVLSQIGAPVEGFS